MQGNGAGSGAAALATMEQLARRAADFQAAGPSASGGGAQGGQPAAVQPRVQQNGHAGGMDAQGHAAAAARRAAAAKPPPRFTGKFRVERDPAWRTASAERLGPLMGKALPPLCAHPSAAVRAALSRGALWPPHQALSLLWGCTAVPAVLPYSGWSLRSSQSGHCTSCRTDAVCPAHRAACSCRARVTAAATVAAFCLTHQASFAVPLMHAPHREHRYHFPMQVPWSCCSAARKRSRRMPRCCWR